MELNLILSAKRPHNGEHIVETYVNSICHQSYELFSLKDNGCAVQIISYYKYGTARTIQFAFTATFLSDSRAPVNAGSGSTQ